jgi:hypothetical protein
MATTTTTTTTAAAAAAATVWSITITRSPYYRERVKNL